MTGAETPIAGIRIQRGGAAVRSIEGDRRMETGLPSATAGDTRGPSIAGAGGAGWSPERPSTTATQTAPSTNRRTDAASHRGRRRPLGGEGDRGGQASWGRRRSAKPPPAVATSINPAPRPSPATELPSAVPPPPACTAPMGVVLTWVVPATWNCGETLCVCCPAVSFDPELPPDWPLPESCFFCSGLGLGLGAGGGGGGGTGVVGAVGGGGAGSAGSSSSPAYAADENAIAR